ncbi:MAG: DUF5693 family protein [Candidatus Bipolaricaulota bacterium]
MKRITAVISLIILLLSLVTASYVLFRRVSWEKNNKRFGVAASFEELRRASSSYDLSTEQLAQRGRENGLNTVVFELDQKKLEKEPAELRQRVEEMIDLGFTFGVELNNAEIQDSQDLETLETYLDKIEPDFLLLNREASFQREAGISDWLENRGYPLGVIEFRQHPLGTALADRGYRKIFLYHRIFDDEQGEETLSSAIKRLARSVKERNMGMIEFRFFDDRSLSENLAALAGLQNSLEAQGFSRDDPTRIKGVGDSLDISAWYLLPLLGALALLAVDLITGESMESRWTFILLSIAAAAGTFGVALYPIFARQVIALIIAITAPIGLYAGLDKLDPRLENRSKKPKIINSLKVAFFASLFSTLAGLLLSIVLTQYQFTLKLQVFRGVKFALIFPVLSVLGLALKRGEFSISLTRGNYKSQVLLLLAVLFGGFILLRSGNFSFIPIAGIEEGVREWLEQVLIARPRFKEFVLGYPALMLWFYRRRGGRRDLAQGALLFLGFLGQTSVINTFAHLHSPLLLSLLRTANGLLLGSALGFLAVIIYRRFGKVERR